MKKKLLVIFSFSIILCYLIFYFNNSKGKTLIIGEYLSFNKKYDNFYYNNITYKELLNCIKRNDYKIIKNKKIYLNELIGSSKTIIINANKNEYKKRCRNKNKRNYSEFVNQDINNLIMTINKMSSAKIIIIKDFCDENEVKYSLNKRIKNVLFIDLIQNKT